VAEELAKHITQNKDRNKRVKVMSKKNEQKTNKKFDKLLIWVYNIMMGKIAKFRKQKN